MLVLTPNLFRIIIMDKAPANARSSTVFLSLANQSFSNDLQVSILSV